VLLLVDGNVVVTDLEDIDATVGAVIAEKDLEQGQPIGVALENLHTFGGKESDLASNLPDPPRWVLNWRELRQPPY
jgi:hypothetical protein